MATFAKIRSGPHAGQWGIRSTLPVAAGDRVDVVTRKGRRATITIGETWRDGVAYMATIAKDSDEHKQREQDMGRVPTMTTTDCEAILGPRGQLAVTPDNRSTVRKWCTASGLPGAYVATLGMSVLAAIYNDLAGTELLRHRQIAETRAATLPDHSEDEDSGARYETPEESAEIARQDVARERQDREDLARLRSAPAVVPVAADGSAGATLAGLVAPYLADSVTSAVMAKVDERLATVQIVRIEITRADGVTVETDGAKHYQFETALRVVSAGIPLALTGPAGAGKTTMSEQVFEALGQKLYIQPPASGTHDLLGIPDLVNGGYTVTPHRAGFEGGGGVVYDEFDASTDPAVPLVINSALANGYQAFPDKPEPVARHSGWLPIINLNTWGQGADRQYVGRVQLDAATLDRFFWLHMDYDEHLERAIAGGSVRSRKTITPAGGTLTPDQWVDRVQALRRAANDEKARMVISPRASIMGVKLFAAGLSLGQIEDGLIWRGTDGDLRKRIEQRASKS